MKKFVIFSADWCEPSNRIKEVLQQFADRNKITLEVHDINSSEAKKKYVKSVPVIHIYPNGRKVAKDKIYKLYGRLAPTDDYSKMYEVTGTSIEIKTFDQIIHDLKKEIQ
jgi:thiol-disulfide isomerase/thioredoxin